MTDRDGTIGEMWSRLEGVSFVDDGQRVVALPLMDPLHAKPLLLDGPAATVWRRLSEPRTESDLVLHLGWSEPRRKEDLAALMRAMEGERLLGRQR